MHDFHVRHFAYPRYRVHERLRQAESREGASFGALFGSALLLGIISRRRVYYEAIKYEKERNGGFLSPFGYSAVTVAAAVNTVCSMEVVSALPLFLNVILCCKLV